MKKLLFGLLMFTAVRGWGAIVIDTTTYSGLSNLRNPSWSITIGNGSSAANKVAFVTCHWNNASMTISSITIGSNTFNHIGIEADGGNGVSSDLWYSSAPPTGAQTVQVNFSGAPTNLACEATDFTGVDQTTIWESSGVIANSGSPASVTLHATTANDWLIDSWSRTTTGNPTGTNSQTVLVDPSAVSGTPVGASYAGPESTGNFSDSYTFGSGGIDLVGALMIPAVASNTTLTYVPLLKIRGKMGP